MDDKRLLQQLRSVDRLLDAYQQQEPLSRFLTRFFKENRQMGSNDRRAISGLVYTYFRIGRAAAAESRRDRLAMAEFICQTGSKWLSVLKPEWVNSSGLPIAEKIDFLEANSAFNRADVFPFGTQLSASISQPAFINSLFTQPALFIRIHTGHEQDVQARLTAAGIGFEPLTKQTLALPNGTSLDQVKGLNGTYEVQDLSSQRTADFFQANAGEHWWDACAGSGGKSILLKQQQSGVNLLVSDIRNSILRNLDERFEKAGITQYRRKIIDLTKEPSALLGSEQFDGIILDAPCSGSGTWGRSPEMISQFRESQIAQYSTLQKQLTSNVVNYLKPGKPLIYITCSVFAAENEEVVQFIEKTTGLRTAAMSYLTGYAEKADTLFVARLIKP